VCIAIDLLAGMAARLINCTQCFHLTTKQLTTATAHQHELTCSYTRTRKPQCRYYRGNPRENCSNWGKFCEIVVVITARKTREFDGKSVADACISTSIRMHICTHRQTERLKTECHCCPSYGMVCLQVQPNQFPGDIQDTFFKFQKIFTKQAIQYQIADEVCNAYK